MRVAIGEFKQESNTFAAVPTTIEDFKAFHLWFGDAVFDNLRGTNTEVAGFLDVCEQRGFEALPTMAGFAISGAPVRRESYIELRDRLLERLDALSPLDAVLLALHGAMVAEGEPDPDGATLAAVREVIGSDTPLVVTMDLHANITRRCVEHADIIVGFRTCPHVDQRRTGQRAASLLARWFAGTIEPVMAFEKIPMVTPASTQVDFYEGPFTRLMDAAAALEERGALAASLFSVQPWLDIPEMGYASVVVTDRDRALARESARALARQAWEERHALMDVELVPPEEAIARALAHPEGPVILSDLADGTGAGSPGDSPSVLAALLAADPPARALAYIFDPEVAGEAASAGVGNAVHTHVGGKRDNVYNHPVDFAGTVRFAAPATFRFEGRGYGGVTMDMGLSAVLQSGNIYLLVTSKPVMTVDPGLYRAVGLEPRDAQIVVVKSHIQFRAGYAGLARDIILLDTPGMSSDHLEQLDFRHVDRPLFPFDRELTYQCDPS